MYFNFPRVSPQAPVYPQPKAHCCFFRTILDYLLYNTKFFFFLFFPTLSIRKQSLTQD